MKTMLKVLSFAAIFAASAPLVLASSITIESFSNQNSSGNTANTSSFIASPAGISNTVMLFVPNVHGSTGQGSSSTTYDIPTVAPWANLNSLSSSSSWISYNPGTWVGGPVVAPGGNYTYTSTFQGATDDGGNITVLADDTTSVYLNNTLIVAQGVTEATNCTKETPNCVKTATYDLSGFVNGTNTLTFVVAQDFGSATGLDFVGTVTSPRSSVAATPEPSSLFLLGTGLLTAVGAARRKFKV